MKRIYYVNLFARRRPIAQELDKILQAAARSKHETAIKRNERKHGKGDIRERQDYGAQFIACARKNPMLAYDALTKFLAGEGSESLSPKQRQSLLMYGESIRKKILLRVMLTIALLSTPLLAGMGLSVYLLCFWGKQERAEALQNWNAYFHASAQEDPIEVSPFTKTEGAKPAETKPELQFPLVEVGNQIDLQTARRLIKVRPSKQVLETTVPTVVVSADGRAFSAEVCANAKKSPKPDLEVRSTLLVDQRLTPGSLERNESWDRYASMYAHIYSVPQLSLPIQSMGTVFSVLVPERDGMRPFSGGIAQYRIILLNGDSHTTLLGGSAGQMVPVYIKDPKFIWPYSIVAKYKPMVLDAASIVAKHHPDMKATNLAVFLLGELTDQVRAFSPEDLWQDRSACVWSSCEQIQAFDAEIEGSNLPIGVNLWGGIKNLPWWMWGLAARTNKYNLEKQGFGLFQVVFGFAKKAGETIQGVNDYEEVLPKSTFEDPKALMRAILDPEKAVYIKAMILDYLLGELKATTFRDPRVQYPLDKFPIIGDKQAAREYGLLRVASVLMSFPDLGGIADDILCSNTLLNYYGITDTYSRLFDAELDFPGLVAVRYSSQKVSVIADMR